MLGEDSQLLDVADLRNFKDRAGFMSALEELEYRADGVGIGVVVICQDGQRLVLASEMLDLHEDHLEDVEDFTTVVSMGYCGNFENVSVVADFPKEDSGDQERYGLIEAALNVLACFDEVEHRSLGAV